jgi:hypothetical protein
VVEKSRERLLRVAETYDAERFNRTKLNEVKFREPFQFKMLKMFLDLENLHDNKGSNRISENI